MVVFWILNKEVSYEEKYQRVDGDQKGIKRTAR
jgi:hypothetical protein